MYKKKTIKIEELVDRANSMLARSTCSADGRIGVQVLIESILHETGNYKGFRSLLQEEVPPGELPGVNYEVNENGISVPCADATERFRNTDKTRVQYY